MRKITNYKVLELPLFYPVHKLLEELNTHGADGYSTKQIIPEYKSLNTNSDKSINYSQCLLVILEKEEYLDIN